MITKLINFLAGLINALKTLDMPKHTELPANFAHIPWMESFEADLKLDWSEKSPGNNARIVECFRVCGYGDLPDETAWCGVYVGRTLKLHGYKPPLKCAFARNYSDPAWGTTLAAPLYGCIVNVERNAPGGDSHVGFLLSWNEKSVRIGGGNQSNKVTDTLVVPRSTVISFKLPPK